jgi:hypothetical protein
MRVGVVAALLLIAIVVVACGSSSGGSSAAGTNGIARSALGAAKGRPDTKRHSHLVRWTLSGVPRGRKIKISVVAGYCGSGARPVISEAHLQEKGKQVLIGAIVTELKGPLPCQGVDTELNKVVTLAKPIGRRSLYDSGVNPPAKRWPRP